MASTDTHREEDVTLSLQKVFRVFAGTLEDINGRNDARPETALSEQSYGEAKQSIGYTMKGTAT